MRRKFEQTVQLYVSSRTMSQNSGRERETASWCSFGENSWELIGFSPRRRRFPEAPSSSTTNRFILVYVRPERCSLEELCVLWAILRKLQKMQIQSCCWNLLSYLIKCNPVDQSPSLTHGKTHGVVILLLLIKTKVKFDGVSRWCNIIQYNLRASSYTKKCYVIFQQLWAYKRPICAVCTLIN